MNPNPQQPQKVTEEQAIKESFKSSLEDTISILEKISPLCENIDDLIGMLNFALKNDSQLALIMHQIAPKQMRR